MTAIKVENVVKTYKTGICALNGLNLTVKNNEIFSLLGANGAGKSTLINILTTFLKPTSGKITMLGRDLLENQNSIRSKIACVSQNITIDHHLSLMENMLFQSRLYRVDKKIAKKRIPFLLEKFGLTPYLNYPTTSYSGGVKRRLDIAMNMIASPKILFLDEPTTGMDVASRKAMWARLKSIRDDFDTTIFLTTHYLEEADYLSNYICIMKDGVNIAEGTPDALKNHTKQNTLAIGFNNKKDLFIAKETLVMNPLTQYSKTESNTLYLHVKDSKIALKDCTQWLLDNPLDFKSIEILKPSLEDVFCSLTKTANKEVVSC